MRLIASAALLSALLASSAWAQVTRIPPQGMPAVGHFEDAGKPSQTPAPPETTNLKVGEMAPNFITTDVKNFKFKLSDYLGRIVVLEWTSPECPFTRWHYGSSNMQNLQSEARKSGVIWITINSSGEKRDGYLSKEDAVKYMGYMHMMSNHFVLDPDGSIGHLYGAKTTPHMFVINEEGNIAYMGALDDQPTPAPHDNEKSVNYVRNAVNSLIQGTAIAVPSTQAYGCSVKYAKPAN